MDGVTVISVVRQVRVITFADINQPVSAPPVVQQPELPPPIQRNQRCHNAFTLFIMYFVGIGSIVLGAVRLNDCPAEKMLPKGLVIFGGMLMVSRFLNCVYDCRSICEEQSSDTTPSCLVLLNLLFLLAEIAMFIALCYYAFSVNPTTKPEDHDLKNYCDYGLYTTSFYGCIITLIIFGLAFIIIGFAVCSVCCQQRE